MDGFCEGCTTNDNHNGAVELEGDSCPRCHVLHGEPCVECGRRGYHKDSCSEVSGRVTKEDNAV